MKTFVDYHDEKGEEWKQKLLDLAHQADTSPDEVTRVICEYFRNAHVHHISIHGDLYEVHVDLLETKE